MSRSLKSYKRIVVKIGSALLVERGELKRAWLEALISDIVTLSETGSEVLIVSSGSIALGRGVLGLPKGPLKLEESQASAPSGHISQAQAYSRALGTYCRKAG
ncbi:MAG: glutamate 5-kinase, partial [Roseibium sp.]|nr:glutamate 5-kinase [Roseibium sp.]